MNQNSITCPQTRRTYSRRKLLAKWLRDPRWKRMLAEHAHIPEAECVYCHRKHGQIWNGKPVKLTINHASRHLYLSEELYLTWDPQYMEVTCLSCNRHYERGMKPCPACLKKGKLVYILDRDSECNSCYLEKHPLELQKAQEGRELFKKSIKDYNADRARKRKEDKANHPCKSHKIGGTCALVPITAKTDDKKCKFTPSKALKMCDKAVAKKKFVKIQFPCDRRRSDQKCARKPGMICGYSAAKAKTNCSYFKERVKKP